MVKDNKFPMINLILFNFRLCDDDPEDEWQTEAGQNYEEEHASSISKQHNP